MSAPFVAILIRKQHDVVDAFRGADATSPSRALPLHVLGVDDGVSFRRLFANQVIREARPGAFYLDEPGLSALQSLRRRIALMLVTLLTLLTAMLTVSVATGATELM
jgi:hypothetical protein